MSAHEATVEVLTAEVRVLMVGSRQVTLSVYSQLDEVYWSWMTPFGRVSPKDADYWKQWFVGVDDESGALVRSWLPNATGVRELRKSGESGRVPSGNGSVISPTWRDCDDVERDRICEASEEWSELPLIVLAGLR